MTMNALPLLGVPAGFTTMSPVVAPDGTLTKMDVALQLIGVAARLLNLTVLDGPCVPKPVPMMVTDELATPALTPATPFTVRLVMVGVWAERADTVKRTTKRTFRETNPRRQRPTMQLLRFFELR
jgi:hypothetical protein